MGQDHLLLDWNLKKKEWHYFEVVEVELKVQSDYCSEIDFVSVPVSVFDFVFETDLDFGFGFGFDCSWDFCYLLAYPTSSVTLPNH